MDPKVFLSVLTPTYPNLDMSFGRLINIPSHVFAEPQMTVMGILTHVAVRTLILSDPKSACDKMFIDGRRDGDIYRTGPIEIDLGGSRSYVSGMSCGLGAWYDSTENASGPDHVSLIAHLNNWTYEQALDYGKRHFGLTDEKILSFGSHEIDGWERGGNLLRCEFETDVQTEMQSQSIGRRTHLYRNASGIAILIADEWVGCRDGLITTYRWLLRRKKDGRLRWLGSSLGAHLPFFNMEFIAANPTKPILLVGTEAEAEQYDCGVIRSTVPGGLRNLVDADAAPIAGRAAVEVALSPADMGSGALIHEWLRSAGVEIIRFRLPGEYAPISFERLEEAANQRGIMLEKPLSSDLGRPPTISVSGPGEPIHGSDVRREMLLSPIILEGEIIWIYGGPKVNKTFVGLTLSDAVSSGSAMVGKWTADQAHGVLHVDGETAPDQLQKLIDMVLVGAGKLPGDHQFSVLCAKSQKGDFVLDLETEEAQSEIEGKLKGIKMVVFDNFQSLTSNGPRALRAILPWLRKLTRMGIAVVVLDHTNREGDIQGSIAKERVADLTMSLRYPDEDAKAEGRILVEFPSPRRLYGEDAEEFQLRRVSTKATKESPASFRFELVGSPQAPAQSKAKRIARMALVTFAKEHLDLKYPMIEKRYQIARSSAHGALKAAKALSGDNRKAFEIELKRLIDGDAD